ncbi:MAG: ABC transporter ATP-binding protein [Oscillospiraceae bacterium]|nr:ABC transporter ATP-binding protein [Oscillospiraceae bacterium]
MTLTAKQLSKEFPRKSRTSNCFTALCPLDFTLEPGKLTVLTGRSGSGKSTLLNVLAGLMQPTQGQVLADGQDLYAMPDVALSEFRNRHIGVVPQGQTAVYSLSLLENILLPVTLFRRPSDAEQQRAQLLLTELGIVKLADVPPAELSGGEMKRMAIARALLPQPEIVLADEPTADLDEENTDIVFRALQTAAKNGAAVLAVTHEQGAERYADRVCTMHNGILEG